MRASTTTFLAIFIAAAAAAPLSARQAVPPGVSTSAQGEPQFQDPDCSNPANQGSSICGGVGGLPVDPPTYTLIPPAVRPSPTPGYDSYGSYPEPQGGYGSYAPYASYGSY